MCLGPQGVTGHRDSCDRLPLKRGGGEHAEADTDSRKMWQIIVRKEIENPEDGVLCYSTVYEWNLMMTVSHQRRLNYVAVFKKGSKLIFTLVILSIKYIKEIRLLERCKYLFF